MSKDMATPNKSHMDSASGLRSANDMSDSIPAQGWGGVEEVPGTSMGGGAPLKTASEAGVSYGGPAGGPPMSHNPDGPSADDTDVSLTTLMDVGEKPDSTTGAGLRSAVGSNVAT